VLRSHLASGACWCWAVAMQANLTQPCLCVQLLRHTPRLEKRDQPSTDLDSLLGQKIQVRGSVVKVQRPVCVANCSILKLETQVRPSAPLLALVLSPLSRERSALP
jgi:hypothetical protein